MIINCRTWHTLPDQGRSQRRRVFVDGREIHDVWYLDTDAGMVKTYDLTLGEQEQNPENFYVQSGYGVRFDRSKFPPDWELEVPRYGVVSRVLRGEVTLAPWEDE